MRRQLCYLFVGLLLFPAISRGDEAKAKKLIEQSLKATGGAEKIAKVPASTFKERGTYYGQGDGLPYEGVYSVHLPDKFSMEIQGVFKLVFNAKQGWTRMGNETKEMTADELAIQKGNAYHGWVASLLPLKDKDFKLSYFGIEKIDGKEAEGVSVAREGRSTVTLFFDKQSHLLVKSTATAKSTEQGNKEVSEEIWYKDFKAIEGIQSPTKMLIHRDGKKFVESEVFDEVRHEKLDDSLFAKP